MNTVINLRRIVATTLIASIAASFALAAYADDAAAPQLVVKYADLNLSAQRAADELYHRIAAAAATVCRSLDDDDLASRPRVKACVHQAIADAVVKVDRPELFVVYRTKNHESQPALFVATRDR